MKLKLLEFCQPAEDLIENEDETSNLDKLASILDFPDYIPTEKSQEKLCCRFCLSEGDLN